MNRPKLEVIRKGTHSGSGKAPILLVHGAWHGAWCWDRGFMDRLAAAGHEAVALSLRGHGTSEGRSRFAMRLHGLAGYIEDVAGVADGLRSQPVLVGHSLGAFVVQRYLAEGRRARGGVLLAPMPHTGVLPFLLRLMRSDPIAVAKAFATLTCRPIVGDAGRAARLLFTPATVQAEVNHVFPSLGDESFRVFIELLRPSLNPLWAKVPVAVFAASADAVFTAEEIDATARAYGVAPVIFQNMGHDMMLDPAWPAVADRLIAWCTALNQGVHNATVDGSPTAPAKT